MNGSAGGHAIGLVEVTVPGARAAQNPVVTALSPVSVSGIIGDEWEALDIPSYVTATLAGGLTARIPVVWDNADYDSTLSTPQTFSGTLTLPGGISNSGNLTPSLTVTLGEAPAVTGYTLTPSQVTAVHHTPFAELNLPAAAVVEFSDQTVQALAITWLESSYDPETLGEQTVAGTVELPWGGTHNVTIRVTLTPILAEKVTLNQTTLTLCVSESHADHSATLTATVTPANASDRAVIWHSEDTTVATVSASGLVTAVGKGTTTVTATARDGSLAHASCVVTVKDDSTTGGTTPTPPSKPTTPTTPTQPSEPTNPGTTTETVENEDGSTTTTVTDTETGKVTETTVQPDGAKVEKVTTPEEGTTVKATDASGAVVAEVVIPEVIPEPETKFDDVAEGHWAEQAINNMAALGLVNGVDDGKYDPNAPMTRGALATVLYRLANTPEGAESTFADVAEGKYYSEAVAWAAKVGVVNGVSDNEFAPNDEITREQLAVMLVRYAALLGMDTTADAADIEKFADATSAHGWATDGLAWCVKNGIMQGMGDNILSPTTTVTRAQVATMLDRLIGLIK